MKNILSATLLLALLIGCATPGVAAAKTAITPDVVYGHKDGMALTFDVFQPTDNANGAGILFMVSGGWVSQWYPPEMTSRYAGRFPALDFEKDLAATVSPILFVTGDDPPTLLIHGDADTLVPLAASKSIHAKFKETNLTTNLVIIEGGDHGFRNPDHRRQADDALLAWFGKYLVTDSHHRFFDR